MSSISNFIGALRGGGARPNRFEVVIDFPAFSANSDVIRKTPFLVVSAQLPASNLSTTVLQFRGREVKLAGSRTFESFDCTFLNDTDFELRDSFEKWHNAINAYNSNTGIDIPDQYMATISVYQLDGKNKRIKEYILKYAFPTVIGPIELEQGSNDEVERFNVTFEYSDISNGNST